MTSSPGPDVDRPVESPLPWLATALVAVVLVVVGLVLGKMLVWLAGAFLLAPTLLTVGAVMLRRRRVRGRD